MNKRLTKISKYMTFVLRHEPQSIGLRPDKEGFFPIDELVQNSNASGKTISAEQVQQVVASHDPPLFAFSDDGDRIRAVESVTKQPRVQAKRSPWNRPR